MRNVIKAIVIAAAVLSAAPAYAMTYYLTNQWYNSNGNHMCEYSNGTVLNVGYRICPLNIQG